MPISQRTLAIVAAAALSVATLLPAHAQQQEGLVNVNVSGVTVQVPIAVAATVCDVAVNVLAQDIGPGETACNTDASAVVDNEQFMRFAERQGVADSILNM